MAKNVSLKKKNKKKTLALDPSNWFPNNFEVHSKLCNGGTQNSAVCLDVSEDRKELDGTGIACASVGPRATWQPQMVQNGMSGYFQKGYLPRGI